MQDFADLRLKFQGAVDALATDPERLAPAPVVNVTVPAPVVNIEPAVVNITPPKAKPVTYLFTVGRDDQGRISSLLAEPLP